jgi:hypothetical protein
MCQRLLDKGLIYDVETPIQNNFVTGKLYRFRVDSDNIADNQVKQWK